MSDEGNRLEVVSEAAVAASAETTEAIERAAEKNDDPAVASELEDAALASQKTASRVGWLRAAIARVFGTSKA